MERDSDIDFSSDLQSSDTDYYEPIQLWNNSIAVYTFVYIGQEIKEEDLQRSIQNAPIYTFPYNQLYNHKHGLLICRKDPNGLRNPSLKGPMMIHNLIVNYEDESKSPLCIHCGLEKKEEDEGIHILLLIMRRSLFQLLLLNLSKSCTSPPLQILYEVQGLSLLCLLHQSKLRQIDELLHAQSGETLFQAYTQIGKMNL